MKVCAVDFDNTSRSLAGEVRTFVGIPPRVYGAAIHPTSQLGACEFTSGGRELVVEGSPVVFPAHRDGADYRQVQRARPGHGRLVVIFAETEAEALALPQTVARARRCSVRSLLACPADTFALVLDLPDGWTTCDLAINAADFTPWYGGTLGDWALQFSVYLIQRSPIGAQFNEVYAPMDAGLFYLQGFNAVAMQQFYYNPGDNPQILARVGTSPLDTLPVSPLACAVGVVVGSHNNDQDVDPAAVQPVSLTIAAKV